MYSLLALPLVLSLAASLASLLPLDPPDDPAFPVLLALRPPLADYHEVLVIQAPTGTVLSPARLGLLLESLAEFGSGPALVDLPLDWMASDASSASALERTRNSIGPEFGLVSDNLRAFWLGLRSGSLRPADASSSFDTLMGLVASSRDRLLVAANPPSEELPTLLAALSFAPPVIFGLPLEEFPGPLGEDEVAFLSGQAAILSFPIGLIPAKLSLPSLVGFVPPPKAVEAAAAGLSWSLRDDMDFWRGRFLGPGQYLPLASYEGRVLPGAALLLLAKRLGVDKIEVNEAGLRLEAARLPRRASRDLFIPLDGARRVIFDLPASEGPKTRTIALTAIEDYRQAEGALVAAMRSLERAGYLVDRRVPSLDWAKAAAIEDRLLTLARGTAAAPGASASTGEAAPTVDDLSAAKLVFFGAVKSALKEKERIDALCAGLLTTPGLNEEGRAGVEKLRDEAGRAFDATAAALRRVEEGRSRLVRDLGAAVCIIGEEPHRSGGGFIPQKGARPVDPSGDTADFIRAGLSGRFIGAADPGIAAWMSAGVALVLVTLLLVLRPRIVLALGLLAALGFVAFSGFALSEASLWVSPLAPILACLAPGLAASAIAAFRALRGQPPSDPGARAS